MDTSGRRYRKVRTATEELAAPLGPEDQTVQSMPDVSPTKWHRAHVTWFFETFLLIPHVEGYEPFDESFGYLFNSYYESMGPRHARVERGVITRPTVADISAYRAHVDEAMAGWLSSEIPTEAAALVELGLHHEQQHQELLLMDIKHVLGSNPMHPVYREATGEAATKDAPPVGWFDVDGGKATIGYDLDGFSYDNEGPAHTVWLEPFRIADRPVTCGEWIDFIADGGYRRPELWLSDGWAAVNSQEWTSPMYWSRAAEAGDDAWNVFTLGGERPVDRAEPVCHVSHYEANAYATWAGARLPTEAEWEVAVTTAKIEPSVADNLAPLGRFHPESIDVAGRDDPPLRRVFGDVWEWTASPYVAYPGFEPAPGAVGEYNGKFMSNQMVLRGGCAATPGDHVRLTYRNFFPPHARWAFAGLRLATNQ